MGRRKNYERKGIYSVSDVLFDIDREIRNFDGDKIDMTSSRYKTFKKSLTCVNCGLRGTYFAKERHVAHGPNARYHFNLYGENAQGAEVMLTKDHIVPKSKGGPNSLENYQTMCEPCNGKKGNTYNDA